MIPLQEGVRILVHEPRVRLLLVRIVRSRVIQVVADGGWNTKCKGISLFARMLILDIIGLRSTLFSPYLCLILVHLHLPNKGRTRGIR